LNILLKYGSFIITKEEYMEKVLTIKEFNKMSEEYAKVKYTCKNCGRKAIIPYNVDKQLCKWCKYYVFKSDQEEFKYRIKEKVKWI
jgi:ribosomal protein L37E